MKKKRKKRGRKEKKEKRECGSLIDARNERVHSREISHSSLGGGDAVGPTGSPGGPSVSFDALVARPRVYRIEDLRKFSESFVHPRTGSRGFSRALGTTTQYTAWQPGPRVVCSLHRRRMERINAVFACLGKRTKKTNRSLERACFCSGRETYHQSYRCALHGLVPISTPEHVQDRPFIVIRSVVRAWHERGTQQRNLEVRGRGCHERPRSLRAPGHH